MVHSARPLKRSPSSLPSRAMRPARSLVWITSGERKENILEPWRPGGGAQLGERATAAHSALRQQHEAVAHAFCVRELVNGQEQRAAAPRNTAQQCHHLTCLPQVEAVK